MSDELFLPYLNSLCYPLSSVLIRVFSGQQAFHAFKSSVNQGGCTAGLREPMKVSTIATTSSCGFGEEAVGG